MLINIDSHILYEDDYILVVNKPAGLMVEPDRNQNPNLLQQVKDYLRKSTINEVYAQHIHRLDRPVSGIVLFTKNRSVLRNLSEQFAERKVKKYYQALTGNAPLKTKGILENWHRKEKKKAAIYDEEIPYAEKAVLDYETEELAQDRILWNITLHTGKYHQIRAQLSKVGCPVIGDSLYNSGIPYKPDAIALHACRLIFVHPVTGQEIAIVSESDFFR